VVPEYGVKRGSFMEGGNGKLGGKPISSSKSIRCYLAEWVENLPEILGPSVPLSD
jgi:hypothetical protein